MEIISIKGDNINLLYHPSEGAAEVGQQIAILEEPDKKNGLIVQIISNDSLEYPGLQQEMIQNILEQRIAESHEIVLDREQSMGEIKSLKIATAKIRKRVVDDEWVGWDGWIPTRNVEIKQVEAKDLIAHILPEPEIPLRNFLQFNGTDITLDGVRLDMINVITGIKGSGKSHFSKQIVISLMEKKIPVVIFDVNGEYIELPNVQVLRWGQNFKPNLAEVGYTVLLGAIEALRPLPENSASAFEARLPHEFRERIKALKDQGKTPIVDVEYLLEKPWDSSKYVQDAIISRLRMIKDYSLFANETDLSDGKVVTGLHSAYATAAEGKPVVFDMRTISNTLQRALVKSILKVIEKICDKETKDKTVRYPYIFFEEAHFYVAPESILNIITRGRHIGISSFFVTNSPQDLPDTVFRQLDNLFLLTLSHEKDIQNTSQNSFTDKETIKNFATRMPKHHALIIGNITKNYPLVVKVGALPSDVPPTGKTKSTWDRFKSTT